MCFLKCTHLHRRRVLHRRVRVYPRGGPRDDPRVHGAADAVGGQGRPGRQAAHSYHSDRLLQPQGYVLRTSSCMHAGRCILVDCDIDAAFLERCVSPPEFFSKHTMHHSPGTYDVHADLTTNTAIASPLLSRFDVVLVLRDTASKAWDTQVSTFLLKQAVRGANTGSTSGGASGANDKGGADGGMSTQYTQSNGTGADPASIPTPTSTSTSHCTTASHWSLRKLRQYVAFVKHSVHPVVSPEARTLLVSCPSCVFLSVYTSVNYVETYTGMAWTCIVPTLCRI